MQILEATRNAMLDAFGTAVGAGGSIVVMTGVTTLATLPSLSFSAAATGSKTFAASPDTSGDANGTPDSVLMKSSGGTTHATFTAGTGTQATMGTVTIAGNVVTAIAVTGGGTGYIDGVPYPITFTGGTPTRVAQAYIKSTGADTGVLKVGNIVITDGGAGYVGAPTATVGPPKEFTFSDQVYLGGNVSLTSGTLVSTNV